MMSAGTIGPNKIGTRRCSRCTRHMAAMPTDFAVLCNALIFVENSSASMMERMRSQHDSISLRNSANSSCSQSSLRYGFFDLSASRCKTPDLIRISLDAYFFEICSWPVSVQLQIRALKHVFHDLNFIAIIFLHALHERQFPQYASVCWRVKLGSVWHLLPIQFEKTAVVMLGPDLVTHGAKFAALDQFLRIARYSHRYISETTNYRTSATTGVNFSQKWCVVFVNYHRINRRC